MGAEGEPSETAVLGVAVIRAIANTQGEVPMALAAAMRQRADSLFIPSNTVNAAEKKWLAEFALFE